MRFVILLWLGIAGIFLITRDDYFYVISGLIFTVVAAIGIIRILLAAEVSDDEDEHEENHV